MTPIALYLHDASIELSHTKIHNQLVEQGTVLIRNFIRPATSLATLKQQFLDLCSTIGRPIGHDKAGTLIWDIKSSAPGEAGKSKVITYSQHNHEADLHTDSQYSSYPEDYFGLLTLKRASCGGGSSFLLSLKDILAELDSSAAGRATREVLETTTYPFIVPSVFKQKQGAEPEFNYGYILQDGEIRFRVDTIQKALAYDSSLCTPKQVEAFNFMVDLVRNTPHRLEFFLEDGDLILINNKTMLHGRSSFTDPERHLLRIRMNKHAQR